MTDTQRSGWGTTMAGGSGVLVGRDNQYTYILTASHVVDPGTDIDVFLYWRNGQVVPARQSRKSVVHRTSHGDVAIVKMQTTAPMTGFLPICPRNLAPTGLGDSDLSSSFRTPILSVGCDHGDPPYCWTAWAIGKSYQPCGRRNHPYITTSYPPVSGRSGGPLVSTLGYVVGVCSSTSGTTGSFSSLPEIWRVCDAAGLSWLYDCQTVPSVPQFSPPVQPIQPVPEQYVPGINRGLPNPYRTPENGFGPHNFIQPQAPSCPCPGGICPRGAY